MPPVNLIGKLENLFYFRDLFYSHDDVYSRDVFVQGDCDAAVEKISKELGWFKELEKLEKAYRPPKNTQTLYGTKHKTNQWDDKVRSRCVTSFYCRSCNSLI